MTAQLLAYLRSRANRRGLVLVSEATLLRELPLRRREIVASLKELTASGTIDILAPLPFLVVALRPRPWSGSNNERVVELPENSTNPRSVHREVPVSSAAAATQQPEDGGAGEGTALLDQVLVALGPEADREEFRGILAGRDANLVRRCLRRVDATKRIRVSRAALFRSLLAKLSD